MYRSQCDSMRWGKDTSRPVVWPAEATDHSHGVGGRSMLRITGGAQFATRDAPHSYAACGVQLRRGVR